MILLSFIAALKKLVLVEMILLSQLSLLFIVLAGKERFPAWAEVDVPAPEAAKQRLWILVIVSSEFAILAGVCHNIIVLKECVKLHPFSEIAKMNSPFLLISNDFVILWIKSRY